MTLIVNGAPHDLLAGSLADALVALGYGDALVATAVNGEFVPADARAQTPLSDGDRVEVVAPMQGG